MATHQTLLSDVVKRDPRYPYEAYEFVFGALAYTQEWLDRVPAEPVGNDDPGPQYHVSGPELLEGARRFALREFGLMARTVLRRWNINRTDDIGAIVFNLVAANLMTKQASDTHAAFHDLYDLDQALVAGYRIELDELERAADAECRIELDDVEWKA